MGLEPRAKPRRRERGAKGMGEVLDMINMI